ncbi:hypothetical protein [Rhizobium phaseoli]|uniref:hypothetical protein n=1 Tax=Rhizobium phaseoli TaxID=396 RepID=UPI00111235BF|nr:hypothetical protein [Rhizobium phaseoli]
MTWFKPRGRLAQFRRQTGHLEIAEGPFQQMAAQWSAFGLLNYGGLDLASALVSSAQRQAMRQVASERRRYRCIHVMLDGQGSVQCVMDSSINTVHATDTEIAGSMVLARRELLQRACCHEVHVFGQEDRIMDRLEVAVCRRREKTPVAKHIGISGEPSPVRFLSTAAI